MSRKPVLLLLALLAAAGCTSPSEVGHPAVVGNTAEYLAMATTPFNATGSYSMPLEPGQYGYAEPIGLKVPSFDGTQISIGIHRPSIPGCPTDLTAANFPEECKTPILLDAGPYFTEASVKQLSTRPPTGIWFVPHGYTMVYMALRGTGGSDGCMEFMSMNEQKDVDAIVTWLGQQPWSTGKVGMIGRSYDGTTPWWPAALGNPYLKTIVPISGITDQGDLMFANGTSELRGPIMSSYVYWFTYGLEPELNNGDASSQACPEVAKGAAAGMYASETGDLSMGGTDDYWAVRSWKQQVLDHYNGSVYIVHGMQDWNVNPRMVVPYFNALQDKGLNVKMWLGQWPHAYPDRSDEHTNVRWDWSETLLRWFDHELKGADVDTGPAVEVEDHRHTWWVEDSYPVRDAQRTPLTLNSDSSMTEPPGASGECQLASIAGGDSVTGETNVQTCSFTSTQLPSAVRVSGLVNLALKVTPTTATGGTVYAQLYDIYPDAHVAWLGHAWINLQYYNGGHEKQTLVPGTPVLARMQFEPLEGYLPAGHQLRLVLQQDVPAADGVIGTNPNIDTLPRIEQGPMVVGLDGSSVLALPFNHHDTPSAYETYPLDRQA